MTGSDLHLLQCGQEQPEGTSEYTDVKTGRVFLAKGSMGLSAQELLDNHDECEAARKVELASWHDNKAMVLKEASAYGIHNKCSA